MDLKSTFQSCSYFTLGISKLDLVNKKGLITTFTKSSFGCTKDPYYAILREKDTLRGLTPSKMIASHCTLVSMNCNLQGSFVLPLET